MNKTTLWWTLVPYHTSTSKIDGKKYHEMVTILDANANGFPVGMVHIDSLVDIDKSGDIHNRLYYLGETINVVVTLEEPAEGDT